MERRAVRLRFSRRARRVLVWVYYTARIILFDAEVVAAGVYERLRAGTTQLTARWRGV